ncbi:MAG: hypothetical protein Q9187_007000 [Circinaria calcarea]
MQTSSDTTDRRDLLVSQKSTLPPSPISSEEFSKTSSKFFSKPSSNLPAAIQILKDRRQCILAENWNPIQLRPGDYDELWLQLERKEQDLLRYLEDKVHLDYDPKTFELVIRMPTEIHEYVGGSIIYDIRQQIDIIRTGNNSAAVLAQKIEYLELTSVILEDGARRDPDKEFGYKGAKYPTVVVEISYSQRKKNLAKLADQYIVETSGQIQMVIGIKLNYAGSKKQEIVISYEKLTIFLDKVEDIQGIETIPYVLAAGQESEDGNPRRRRNSIRRTNRHISV